jgi:hypothetical protein
MLAQFDRTSGHDPRQDAAEFVTWRGLLGASIRPSGVTPPSSPRCARGRTRRLWNVLASTRSAAAGAQVLVQSVEARFADLRELIVREQGVAAGRATEAERGTAQGLDFEDEVEAVLRRWAGGAGGCVVERGRPWRPAHNRPSATSGRPDGYRIVVEAKNQASIGLSGRDGILGELDQQWRIARRRCGASLPHAFPAEGRRRRQSGVAVDDAWPAPAPCRARLGGG